MTSRFQTLILREWMQHKRGWLISLFLPQLLFLALLPIGQAHGLPDISPLAAALLFILVSTGAVTAIVWLSAMFQLPGLARRDVQDRSIEFWLSLPASHSESIGATVLTHALLVPLAAVLVGCLSGFIVAAALILKIGGLVALAEVPWLAVVASSTPLLLLNLLGVLLATAWLAPLMLIPMAASAWLKRWGVPVVLLTYGIGGLVLDKVYGNHLVWDLVDQQFEGAKTALPNIQDLIQQAGPALHSPDAGGFSLAAWSMHDAQASLAALASPHFIGGLIVAALCFGLLVLKRMRTV
ncbi:MAG: hypothetical protein ABW005_08090 [Burkholderiaceae bacterium]